MNDRNKPCECGSGRKTKRCCKSPEKMEEARLKIIEERDRMWREKIRKAQSIYTKGPRPPLARGLIAAAVALSTDHPRKNKLS